MTNYIEQLDRMIGELRAIRKHLKTEQTKYNRKEASKRYRKANGSSYRVVKIEED